jgi:hypothetical protein
MKQEISINSGVATLFEIKRFWKQVGPVDSNTEFVVLDSTQYYINGKEVGFNRFYKERP